MTQAAAAWTTEADVIAVLRRRWQRGDYLRALATGSVWTPVDLVLRGPSAGQIAGDFARVQDWAARWKTVSSRRMRVDYRAVGGRAVGTNQLPCRVWIDTPEQLWALLGVAGDVRVFTDLLAFTERAAPALVGRMAAHPDRVLAHAAIWPDLIATVGWIDRHGGPHTYLRQIDVPGVDTKFIETHRTLLADLLDHHLAAERIDRSHPPSEFAGRYGLRRKPALIRFRHLDPAAAGPFTDLSVRADEFARSPVEVGRVVVVENETTFLAFPPMPDAIVIYGGGYAVSVLRSLHWLHERRLIYWGDIDTHGLRILHRIREIFGHTRSMLMDRPTLLAHESQWVQEVSPTTEPLASLEDAEARLYRDLIEDAFGDSVRLEQERIRFTDIERAVARLGLA
ncbi:MAG TPA: Wadjet anti-phage system protein JetD domain-containing protein [Micromonosporaceae bacterium]